jgi:hypothetical protein
MPRDDFEPHELVAHDDADVSVAATASLNPLAAHRLAASNACEATTRRVKRGESGSTSRTPSASRTRQKSKHRSVSSSRSPGGAGRAESPRRSDTAAAAAAAADEAASAEVPHMGRRASSERALRSGSNAAPPSLGDTREQVSDLYSSSI